MIIALRTDSPDAEIHIYYKDGKKVSSYTWRADRQLAKELLRVMHQQLQAATADWPDVTGVIVFKGPGSFTGLRIGITVANTLAYGNDVPVVGAQGDDWLAEGLRRLSNHDNDRIVLPHYGAEANITMPKK